jgi:predicted transposase YdaD
VSKPYDATTKELIERDPLAFVRVLGLPGSRADVIDADVATVTAEADRVIRVREPQEYLLHIEFQASYDSRMGERLLRYNTLLGYRHRLPVRSVLVLLRSEADGPAIQQTFSAGFPGEVPYVEFRYQTLRLWMSDPEAFLESPTLAPFAVLASGTLEGRAPAILSQIARSGSDAGSLTTAAFVLAGLRFTAEEIERFLRRSPQMRESSTYRLLVAEGHAEGRVEGRVEGREEEARALLLRVGSLRLGTPSERISQHIDSLGLEELESRFEALFVGVESWDELFPEHP